MSSVHRQMTVNYIPGCKVSGCEKTGKVVGSSVSDTNCTGVEHPEKDFTEDQVLTKKCKL